jgi:hypothetical protein
MGIRDAIELLCRIAIEESRAGDMRSSDPFKPWRFTKSSDPTPATGSIEPPTTAEPIAFDPRLASRDAIPSLGAMEPEASMILESKTHVAPKIPDRSKGNSEPGAGEMFQGSVRIGRTESWAVSDGPAFTDRTGIRDEIQSLCSIATEAS